MALRRVDGHKDNGKWTWPPLDLDEVDAEDEWTARFVRRLSLRLPDEPECRLRCTAARWVSYAGRISPEEAAEVVSMQWRNGT